MLKGSGKLDQLEAQKEGLKRALSELQTGYAQAIGVGVSQHSRMDDTYREAVEQRMQAGSAGIRA